jgi:hypothetical protein
MIYMDETQIIDEIINKKNVICHLATTWMIIKFIHEYHFIHIVKSIHIANCIHVVKFIHVVSPSCIHLFPFMTSNIGQYTHFRKNTHENCFFAIETKFICTFKFKRRQNNSLHGDVLINE